MLRCMHRGRRNYGRYYSTVGALSHEHCRPSSYSLALSGSVSDAPVSFGVAFQHVLRGNPSEWSHRGRTSDGSGQPEDGWRVPFLSQQLMVYGCSPPFASHTHCRTPLNRPPPLEITAVTFDTIAVHSYDGCGAHPFAGHLRPV